MGILHGIDKVFSSEDFWEGAMRNKAPQRIPRASWPCFSPGCCCLLDGFGCWGQTRQVWGPTEEGSQNWREYLLSSPSPPSLRLSSLKNDSILDGSQGSAALSHIRSAQSCWEWVSLARAAALRGCLALGVLSLSCSYLLSGMLRKQPFGSSQGCFYKHRVEPPNV